MWTYQDSGSWKWTTTLSQVGNTPTHPHTHTHTHRYSQLEIPYTILWSDGPLEYDRERQVVFTMVLFVALCIGIPRQAPRDLRVIEVTAAEARLGWAYDSSDMPESFVINCTTQSTNAIIDAEIPAVLGQEFGQTNISGNTLWHILSRILTREAPSLIFDTGLQEFTAYSCSIATRNVFGTGPTSEAIHFITGMAILTPYVSISFQLLIRDTEMCHKKVVSNLYVTFQGKARIECACTHGSVEFQCLEFWSDSTGYPISGQVTHWSRSNRWCNWGGTTVKLQENKSMIHTYLEENGPWPAGEDRAAVRKQEKGWLKETQRTVNYMKQDDKQEWFSILSRILLQSVP